MITLLYNISNQPNCMLVKRFVHQEDIKKWHRSDTINLQM